MAVGRRQARRHGGGYGLDAAVDRDLRNVMAQRALKPDRFPFFVEMLAVMATEAAGEILVPLMVRERFPGEPLGIEFGELEDLQHRLREPLFGGLLLGLELAFRRRIGDDLREL